MGTLVLVPAAKSEETIAALKALLEEAQTGRVIGVAILAIHPARAYSVYVEGEAKRSPAFARGAVLAIDDHLSTLTGLIR